MLQQDIPLKELRQEERLLEYLYQNGIDPGTPYVLEQLIQQFQLSDIKRCRILDIAKPKREFREEDCMLEERVGVFLHPRFLPPVSHSHSYHEIKYVYQGSVALSADGCSLTLEEGDFCFIAPGVQHCCNIFDEETLLINIEIRARELRSVFQSLFVTTNPISVFYNASELKQCQIPILLCCTGADAELRDLMKVIYDYKAETVRQGCGEQLGEIMIEQMLHLLLQRHQADFSNGWREVAYSQEMFDILTYISKNQKDITLSSLAKHFNYSQAYMSRFIKSSVGISFSELQHRTRLDIAAELLRSTEMPVNSIMDEIGYSGKAHFYRIFHKKFGLTPIELREKFRQT